MSSSPEKQYRLADLMPMIRTTLEAGKSVTIGPKGTSMLPLIRQGTDYVELSPLPDKLKKYDLPLYRRPDGQFVLHRIVKAGDRYTCVGDNQFQLEKNVPHEWMIALVTAVYRGEKRISTDAFSYKAYCRLWHWSRPIRRFYRRVKAFLRHRLLHKT